MINQNLTMLRQEKAKLKNDLNKSHDTIYLVNYERILQNSTTLKPLLKFI